MRKLYMLRLVEVLYKNLSTSSYTAVYFFRQKEGFEDGLNIRKEKDSTWKGTNLL